MVRLEELGSSSFKPIGLPLKIHCSLLIILTVITESSTILLLWNKLTTNSELSCIYMLCGRGLWSVEGSFPWVEKYPDGVSRHSVPLQWAQEVYSHGQMQWKWLKSCLVVTEIPPFHVWNGFVEGTFSMDGKLSRWNQWTLCAIVVGTGSLLPQSDAVEMSEKLSGGHRNTSFHAWKGFVVSGKVSIHRWKWTKTLPQVPVFHQI